MYVVAVTFQIQPTWQAEFLRAVQANAAQSLQAEPGCLQFDVCVSLADPNQVFLYEIYTSAAAFQAHLATPHFVAFNQETQAWVEHKAVALLERRNE